MNCNQKSFEAHMYAKQHYQRLLSARTTISHSNNRRNSLEHSTNRTLNPLDKFEFHLANEKLCNKLVEIYQVPIRRPKRKTKNSKKGMEGVEKNKSNVPVAKPDNIYNQNVKIF